MAAGNNRRADALFFLGKALSLVVLAGLITLTLQMQATKDISITGLREGLGSEISELEEGDANTLKRLYGLDGAEYEGWFLYTSGSMMDVTEVLVVKVRDEDQLSALETAANKRLEEQKNSFNGYGTNQMDLLNHGVLREKGRYFFFGVSEQIDQWEEAFLSCIS